MAARGKRKNSAKSRRKKTPRPAQKPRPKKLPKKPAPRTPKKPAPARRQKKHRDWRAKVNRKDIRDSLRKVMGSLVGRLNRAPLFEEEAVYLRAIANLAGKRRLTPAQTLAALAAMRYASPLYRSAFGAREFRLIEKHQQNETSKAIKAAPALSRMFSNWANEGKAVFYKMANGTLQKWSWDGFTRFMMNPVYKMKRAAAFGEGRFYVAFPTARGGLPKRGRIKIPRM